MRHMRHVGILGILAFAFCSTAMAGDDPAEAKAGDEATVEVADRAGLEATYELRADYVGTGDIAILNNGAIVVTTGGKWYEDEESGESVLSASETVVFGTKNAKQVDAPLFSIISLKDVDINIEWDLTDGTDGVITATDENGLVTQVEFMQGGPATAIAVGESSCETSCTNGDCNITCRGRSRPAAICYCDGATPVCKCIKKPKLVDLMDLAQLD